MFMRKIIATLLGIALCAMAYAASNRYTQEENKEITKDTKTGFLMGVHLNSRLLNSDNYDTLMHSLGVDIGYNLFFSKQWGISLYGSYSYDVTDFIYVYRKNSFYVMEGHTFLFHLDGIYHFYNNSNSGVSLGIVFGGAFGYELASNDYYDNKGSKYVRSGFKALANIGFSMMFKSKHTFNIVYQYTILQPNTTFTVFTNQNLVQQDTITITSPFAFQLTYSYTF